jgi:hypothetical protein
MQSAVSTLRASRSAASADKEINYLSDTFIELKRSYQYDDMVTI